MKNTHNSRDNNNDDLSHVASDSVFTISKASCSPKRIDVLVRGYKLSQILRTALEIRLFALLKNPYTYEEIYTKLGTAPELTKPLLDALVSLGLVGINGELYESLDEAKEFLDIDSPLYQGHFIMLELNNYILWNYLPQLIQSTEVKNQTMIYTDKFDGLYTKAMAEVAMRRSLYLAVKTILDGVPDFKTAKSMLDLGGGHGLYSIAFTQALSNLTSYVLDLPQVIEITNDFIKMHKAEGRVNTIAGDIIYDELGIETYDIIFASHVLYRHTCNREIFDKIYKTLKFEGVFIISQWIKVEKPNLSSALWDISLLLQGYNESALLTVNELTLLLKESCFYIDKIIKQCESSDLTTIILARKDLDKQITK